MTKRDMNRKARSRVVMIVALMLVVCVASIGGTIAWLTDTTDEVVNTFSPSGIDVDLKEETPSESERGNIQIVPGVDIDKNPKVSASADVPYYVFVKVVEDNWPTATNVEGERKVSYSVDTGDGKWQLLFTYTDASDADKKTTVYYRELDENEKLEKVSILTGDKVTVSNQLTKEEMVNITSENAPTLKFTAYAMQKQKSNATGTEGNFTAGEAWNQVKLEADPVWTASSAN